MKLKALCLGTSIIFSLCFGQQYSKSWKDVDYAGDLQLYHRVDIYLPNVARQSYPVVVVIYGSAWFGNNYKEMAFSTLGSPLLNAGFAVVTPNHRSSLDAKFPAQIHDVKAVIRFLRANAMQFQLDTSFIGITGFSSGGHLAALAGTSGGIKQYTIDTLTMDIEGQVGAYLSYSSKVHAVVDWFGPTDLLKMDSCNTGVPSTIDHNSANAPEAVLVGGPVQEHKLECEFANPLTYVDPYDPPFLIFHGDKDPLVPYCQSQLLHETLQQAHVPSQCLIVPNAQHGPGLFEEQYFTMMVNFFLDHFHTTSVGKNESLQKFNFNILPNYPNPCNATTILPFMVPQKAFVSITIYDTLGREVTRLIGEEMEAGKYEIPWNGEQLSTGVYIVQLRIGEIAATQKITLCK